MLYKATVEPALLDLVLRLQKDELFKEFALTGNTALSLQMGHRLATDIYLTDQNSFYPGMFSDHLSRKYQAGNIHTAKDKVSCLVEGVSIEVLSDRSPLIQPLLTLEEVKMLSLEDLGAMKLHALINEGSRFTDWVDLYKLLEQETLEQLIEDYEKKYPGVKRVTAEKVLLPSAELAPEPVHFIGEAVTVHDIAYRLKKAIKEPKRIFESVAWRQVKARKGTSSPDKGRGMR